MSASKSPGAQGLVFEEALLFELSRPGRVGYRFPKAEVGAEATLDDLKGLMRDDIPGFPELSEPEVVRHFTRLSQWNYGIDSGLYPLGSCTMKYNPKVNEVVARMEGLSQLHPAQDDSELQGLLTLLWELQEMLAAISGMDAVTLQPAAGAHGELTALLMARAWFQHKGEARSTVLIPDTAHGTNPSSAALAGFSVKDVASGSDGLLSLERLEGMIDEDTAVLMVTNPNTLGLFERNIAEVADLLHSRGALLYLDGANLNAMMGYTRPGDQGADMMHFNLHKTFSTPHGGGGPGAGPVGVTTQLAPFLPSPIVQRNGENFTRVGAGDQSIGKVRSWMGNVGVLVRAWAYMRELGGEGLKAATHRAVLNARYLQERLRGTLHLPYDTPCMHEVVFSDRALEDTDCSTLDLAKRLIDLGYHPPTVYFPLVVHGALMIEPTETASKETLDAFIGAIEQVMVEARETPELLLDAPTKAVRRRVDEVGAARTPILRWPPETT